MSKFSWVLRLLRVAGTGIFGFMVPRILISTGVPLDIWSQKLGGYITGAKESFSNEAVVTMLGIVIAFLLMAVELWYRPVGRLLLLVFESDKKRGSRAAQEKGEGIRGRIVSTGDFCVADSNLFLGTDGGIPDIYQTGRGSVASRNTVIGRENATTTLFDRVIRSVEEKVGVQEEQRGALLSILKRVREASTRDRDMLVTDQELQPLLGLLRSVPNGSHIEVMLTAGA